MAKKTRAQRFQEILGLISQAAGLVEELKDEVESHYDNLPESLQGSSKGEILKSP
jgi:hypothetical protein